MKSSLPPYARLRPTTRVHTYRRYRRIFLPLARRGFSFFATKKYARVDSSRCVRCTLFDKRRVHTRTRETSYAEKSLSTGAYKHFHVGMLVIPHFHRPPHRAIRLESAANRLFSIRERSDQRWYLLWVFEPR